MSDSADNVLTAVIALLKADATLTALVGSRIYTYVPQETEYPYVRLGITSSDESTLDTSAMLHTLRIQGFSTGKGTKEALAIREAVYNVLQRNSNFVQCEHDGVSTVIQQDEAFQSIIEFRIRL